MVPHPTEMPNYDISHLKEHLQCILPTAIPSEGLKSSAKGNSWHGGDREKGQSGRTFV